VLKNTDFIIRYGNHCIRLNIKWLFKSCCLTSNLLFPSLSQTLFAAVFLLVTFQLIALSVTWLKTVSQILCLTLTNPSFNRINRIKINCYFFTVLRD